MNCQESILIALIVGLLVLMLYTNKLNKSVDETNKSNKSSEGYRSRSRAYSSCPQSNCRAQKVTPDQMLVINPFVWPYSGIASPQDVLSKSEPEGLLSEPDHQLLTN